jgi:GWxTD domain-containing protein
MKVVIACVVTLSMLCARFEAQALQVDVSTYVFKADKNYAEVYLRVDGKSLQWSKKNGRLVSSISSILIFTDSTGNIVAYDKFKSESPVTDTMTDILVLRRVYIPSIGLKLNVAIEDDSDPLNKIQLEQTIKSLIVTDVAALSDIQPLGVHSAPQAIHVGSPLIKNNIYIEPLPYHYVGDDRQSIDAYLEVYMNSSMLSSLFVRYYLQPASSPLTSSPTNAKTKKLNGQQTEPMIISLPLTSYRSGDYRLIVEIMDASKKIITTKSASVTVSNVKADIDYLEQYNDTNDHSFVQRLEDKDLEYILRAHVPIVEQVQSTTLEMLIKEDMPKSRRQFIFNYWKKRSPANPEVGYKAYMDVAVAVDKKFNNNVGKGFQTDRGHIFLKHGKPSNVITVDTEIDAPPYEIWYYNQTQSTKQTNVRFLFYNPSLAHNDFELLHSTCLGERSNPLWEKDLYNVKGRSENGGETITATSEAQSINRNAKRYFNEF